MQVSEANPMVGIDGRTELLRALAGALCDSPEFFGADARPGNIVGTYVLDVIQRNYRTTLL